MTKLPQGLLRRYLPMEEGGLTVTQETRTVKLSISSATPIEQWFATEILEHQEGSVDLSRAKNGGQVLFNHNPDDYVGVIQDCWLDPVAERCYAIVRFDTHPRAEQIFTSVQSGILRNVSIGYRVNEWKMVEQESKNLTTTVRATSWELLEVSFVSVPADPSVGVDRSLSMDEPTLGEPTPVETIEEQTPNEAGAEPAGTNQILIKENTPVELPTELLEAERARTASLIALGDKHSLKKDLVQGWIANGVDLQSARSQVLDLIKNQEPEIVPVNPGMLSRKEIREYRLTRAILNQVLLREGKDPVPGLELEVHNAIQSRQERQTRGFYVPVRDLDWGLFEKRVNQGLMPNYGKRDVMQTAIPELGGNLVDTEIRSSEFIEVLRNRAMILRLGAKVMSGLVGNLDIPRQTGTSNFYWIPEGGTIPQSNLEFDLVALRPRELGTIVPVTRRLLLQSSLDVEALVRFDLMRQMALGLDSAAISGTGVNNEPLGILNTPGINSVSIGANGGALTWNHVVQLETEVSVDNADEGTCFYLTNATVRGKMKTTQKVAGQAIFLWDNSLLTADGRLMGTVNGYQAACSNQVPSDGTKGSGTNLSSMLFGNFADLMFGEWGVFEIMTNPYGAGFQTGAIEVRAIMTADVTLRRKESFAVCTDIVTT